MYTSHTYKSNVVRTELHRTTNKALEQCVSAAPINKIFFPANRGRERRLVASPHERVASKPASPKLEST